MPQFYYASLDSRGKTHKGHIEAGSRQGAIYQLRSEGLIPYEIAQVSAQVGAEVPFWKRRIEWRKSVPKAEVAAMARQLATLLKAGLPLDRALYAICTGDSKSRLSQVITSLRESILGGKDLAQALSEWPNIFSTTFIAMTQAGEASGALDLVMDRLATHLEQEVALRRKARSALTYPILMLIVGLAVLVFLLSFVIPQVTQIFTDMGRQLPLPTRVLLSISDSFRQWWPFILTFLILFTFFAWRMGKSEKGRNFLQAKLFHLPLAGKIYSQVQLGNFARTLGMLLKNGVPLLKALKIVRAASLNVHIQTSIDNMILGIQAGHDLSSFMTNERLYSPIARQMTAAGEKSGQLAEMLLWVAEDAENQSETRLQALTSLLEPVMILILGALVGFVVIAIILPIFEMSTLAG